ncbi:Vegetative incompatibility protein HET-E-1 [Colletotrichum gloeosporioides]|uniref:Vegetative incompatibility protein HET-E-1 n=1 Tax=Colletotrichum gloeosporioides TaxID=474922 RepID=A0A8H4FDS2_COLGL|nr:Vegetative incompatibility protein HET-E-1 [Colletotrichum gloeosporioides]KAF3798155.1 Vegetative incompatibility protein HET-E-1 [Colletotrichum gloeosporioides]
MWLINVQTLELEQFFGSDTPGYAILSHTWSCGEVTFQDWADRSPASQKPGYSKIVDACAQARVAGFKFLWVDTNCINKNSSSELTEAINSMFSWYFHSGVCFAYLSDIPTFTRGWTLQELLAPREVLFYAADWSLIGTRSSLAHHISSATGIDVEYFNSKASQYGWSQDQWEVGERLSWLARRETTRLEDMAYCMLGIFGISMPLVYGEGSRAFMRLQEEILKVSDDHSLFCWSWSAFSGTGSLLSSRPHAFKEASQFTPRESNMPQPYSMTNAGLSIQLRTLSCWSSYIGILNVETIHKNEDTGVLLSGDPNTGRFVRCPYPGVPVHLCPTRELRTHPMHMFMPTNRTGGRVSEATPFSLTTSAKAGVLLSFDERNKFVEIETLPRGRFLTNSSIIDIPFERSALNLSGCQDAESYWFEDTVNKAPNVLGAMVKIKLSSEFQHATESLLFFVKQSQAGPLQEARLHYYRIPHAATDFVGWTHYAAPQIWQSERQGIDRRKYITKALMKSEFADALNPSVMNGVAVAVAARTSKAMGRTLLKHVHLT